jgi:hypothetical protein
LVLLTQPTCILPVLVLLIVIRTFILRPSQFSVQLAAHPASRKRRKDVIEPC